MKPLQILAILATVILCFTGLAMLAQYKPVIDPKEAAAEAEAKEAAKKAAEEAAAETNSDKDHYEKNPFEPAKGDQVPVAELVEQTHQFGRMGLGKVGKHDFIIKNTGNAPLKVARGPTQCKCTVSGLKDQEVPPGGEAAIHLAWEPKSLGPFAQTATIWTNDPKQPELKIGVEGEMFREVDVTPANGWKLENLTTSNPTPFQGAIHSPVIEKFNITKVETSSDRIKVEVTPMTEADLQGPEYKTLSGYLIHGELAGLEEPGKIEEEVIIHTDLADYPKFTLPLVANRIGAITIIGPNWFAGGPMLDLGKVSVEKGKEIKLTVMVPPRDEELKFTDIVSNPGFVQLKLVPEKTGKDLSRERYSLFVTVPPESPKGIWGTGNEGHISLKTNHPQIPEMNIKLHLSVQ